MEAVLIRRAAAPLHFLPRLDEEPETPGKHKALDPQHLLPDEGNDLRVAPEQTTQGPDELRVAILQADELPLGAEGPPKHHHQPDHRDRKTKRTRKRRDDDAGHHQDKSAYGETCPSDSGYKGAREGIRLAVDR